MKMKMKNETINTLKVQLKNKKDMSLDCISWSQHIGILLTVQQAEYLLKLLDPTAFDEPKKDKTRKCSCGGLMYEIWDELGGYRCEICHTTIERGRY